MDEFLDEKNLFFLSFSKGYKAALSNELIEKEPDRNVRERGQVRSKVRQKTCMREGHV
jgi:hypothetical protein